MKIITYIVAFFFSVILASGLIMADEKEKVVFIGDSITHGAHGKLGYVKRLQDKFPQLLCIEAGRSGRKTSNYKEIPSILEKHKDAKHVFIFLGVNDLKNANRKQIKSCSVNMLKIIDMIKKATKAKIHILAPTSINVKTMKRKEVYNENTLKGLVQIKEDYKKIARKKKCGYFSLFDIVSPDNYSDGLHPNTKGHIELAEAIADYIAKEVYKGKLKISKKNVKPVDIKAVAIKPVDIKPVKGWPHGVVKAKYKSAADKAMQPALIYTSKGEKRPLLVALHTWSGGYNQAGGQVAYAKWCIQNNWHFIHPHFRGPNWTPKALGSDYVVKDIESAVEYMKKNCNVDTDRIYLIGVSGGGHCALLMAGRKPEIWAGVSAWCGISDINKWWEQCSSSRFKGYAKHIEKACGGKPDENKKILSECIKRSPVTYLKNAKSVPLDINHGINDGRKGSVPFTHSLNAFNEVAGKKEQLPEKTINNFYETRVAPKSSVSLKDAIYNKWKPLFRKESGNTRITIFDGGHEIVHVAALNWLSIQRKGEKAVWEIKKPIKFDSESGESDSGL